MREEVKRFVEILKLVEKFNVKKIRLHDSVISVNSFKKWFDVEKVVALIEKLERIKKFRNGKYNVSDYNLYVYIENFTDSVELLVKNLIKREGFTIRKDDSKIEISVDKGSEILVDLAFKFLDLLESGEKEENLKGFEYEFEDSDYKITGEEGRFRVYRKPGFGFRLIGIEREEFKDFDKVVEMIKRIAYAMNIFKLV